MARRIILSFCVVIIFCSAVNAATPEIWYSMDNDGNVYRDGEKVNAAVNNVGGSVFSWIEGDSAVWIFNPYNLEHAPVYIPLNDGEHCSEVMQSREGSLFVMSLSSEKIAAYDMSGELVIRTPGVFPAYWVDDYRFIYTSCVPGTRRGRGKNSRMRRGVSVFEIFPNGGYGLPEVLVTPVIKATRTADYTAEGVDGAECIVIKHEGSSEEYMRVSLPAAG